MDHISIEKFKALAKVNEPHCISIFIPTHRYGQEVNEMVDQKNLKNQVKMVRKELEAYNLKRKEIDELLQPIIDLFNDNGFWKHQSDGLAILRSQSHFVYFTIPVFFETFTYINDHFYLKPLIPYLNDDTRFFLLSLSLNGASLYEGFPHQIDKLEVEDLLPEKLEEVVGYDFKEKNLQFRTGQAQGNRAMFHGHGKGKEEEKPEILKYFRAIDEGVLKVVKDKKIPLILVAVDYLVPLYREVNRYDHLEEIFIAGNPEHEDPVLLHEKAKIILKDHFNRERDEKVSAFEKALSDVKASYKEEEIVPAAINQRIDTLFVRNLSESWGMFDKDTNQILLREEKSRPNACLLNMAAVHTILNNGKVYLLDAADMPAPSTKLNAIFRY
jgi:hypothetical protein